MKKVKAGALIAKVALWEALICRLEQEGKHEWAEAVDFMCEENAALQDENERLKSRIRRLENDCCECGSPLLLDEESNVLCHTCLDGLRAQIQKPKFDKSIWCTRTPGTGR